MRKVFTALLLFFGCTLSTEITAKDISFQRDPKIIVLLGPPGVGKGTQAKMLSDAFHIPHISTGDILRNHLRLETELGKQAKEYMEKGKLVPDSLVLNMLFERIGEPDCKNGYILDGFPRTVEQAKSFHEHLDASKELVALNLQVNDQTLIERITGRVMCKQCGKPYHLKFSPPSKKDICNACGGPLYQRTDDTKEVVLERLRVYREQTEPLINFYQKKGKLHTVACDASQESIFSSILQYLK